MINRREALRRVSFIMGGALSAPVITGILQGCSSKPELNWKPQFLTEEQAATVAELAERILPRTDSPGAKDAGVPAYIDLMLKDIYTDDERKHFMEGLEELNKASEDKFGDAFAQLKPEQQDKVLQGMADKAKEQQGKESEFKPFFLEAKELAMVGFFTSEVGATQFLHYVEVPGSYEGCIPLAEVGKAWAT